VHQAFIAIVEHAIDVGDVGLARGQRRDGQHGRDGERTC
jgi:hypothetical protein